MADSLQTNPIVLNVFTTSTDIVISHTPITVSSIVMEGAGAKDTATFIESPTHGTTEVLRLSNAAAGASATWTPAIPFTFQNGLVYDVSGDSLDDGDLVYIFLA